MRIPVIGLIGLLLGGIGIADAQTIRTISVRVAVDEEVRGRAGWEARVRELVSEVNGLYEKECGIRWEVQEIVRWESDNESPGLYADLKREVAPGEADVVIGITGQSLTPRETFLRGTTHPLTRTALIRDFQSGVERITLAHELAHLFGVWHVRDRQTVMHPSGRRVREFRFDEQSARMIRYLRDFDFSRGVKGLNEEQIEQITEWYGADEQFRDGHPVAVAYCNVGDSLARRGERAESVKWFQKGADLDPELLAVQLNLGKTLLELGRFAGAQTALKAAIRIDGSCVSAHVALGFLYFQRREWQKAEASFREALRGDPGNAEAHSNLGSALVQQGRLKEGINAYRKTVELNPDFMEARRNLTKGLYLAKRYNEAQKELETMIRRGEEVDPDFQALLERALQQE